MSHSTLSAQLASLHTKNTTSSRKHEDAIGRGFHHSANAGHTVIDGSTKHKPTVLHQDSRAAAHADVPFTTMRENAVRSLQYLAQHSSPMFELSRDNLPWQTLFGSKSIKYERGLNSTETNTKFDNMIKEALVLLSTCWGDAASSIASSPNILIQVGANIPSAVLYALEYLVQKYYVHVYNAENLLVAFLPHHETFLFDRIIQLIDLAQLPHWAFLRPYSAAKGVIGVPRTIVAKWAASVKDNGSGAILVKRICDLSKRAAKIHSVEQSSSAKDGNVRRGISLFISFALAVIAEALHIQFTMLGSIDESMLRCLVPFVLSAIEPSRSKGADWSIGTLCREWRAFGYVLVSLIAEKCQLSYDLYDAFTVGVIRGALESVKLFQSDHTDVENDSAIMQSVFDSCTDSLIVLASIVSIYTGMKENEELGQYLLLVGSPQKIGCLLSLRCYKSLMKMPLLHKVLGNLSEEKQKSVTDLLGWISSMTIGLASSKEEKSKDAHSYLEILISLITESSLASTWRKDNSALSSAVAACLVLRSVKIIDTETFQLFSMVLCELRSIDAIGFDIGVAYAVNKASNESKGAQTNNFDKIERILEGAGIKKADIPRKKIHGFHDSKAKEAEPINAFDRLLPTRVALEHPSSQLRLTTIEKIASESHSDDNFDDTAEALLRRYTFDDNISVATAAAKALSKFIKSEKISAEFFLRQNILDDTVNGLRSAMATRDSLFLEEALNVSGYALSTLQRQIFSDGVRNHVLINSFDNLLMSIVECIDSSAKLSQAAASLSRALGETKMTKTTTAACKSIIQNIVFQDVVRRCIDSMKSQKVKIQSLCVTFFIRNTTLLSANNLEDELIHLILESCTVLLNNEHDSLNENALIVEKILLVISDLLTSRNNTFLISSILKCLISIPSKIIYEKLSHNCYQILHKSPLFAVVVIEIMCRQNTQLSSVLRLFDVMKDFLIVSDVAPLTMVTIIGFLGHYEVTLRRSTLDILSSISSSEHEHKATIESLSCACSQTQNHSKILMDGIATLPTLLAEVAAGSNGAIFRRVLLNDCASAFVEVMQMESETFHCDAICLQIANIISITEAAGEISFPLLERWSHCGMPILQVLMKKSSDFELASGVCVLIDTVIVMLKGVTIERLHGQEAVLISTGPSTTGRRSRSYSIGAVDGITSIKSYPKVMTDTILALLSEAKNNKNNSCIRKICDRLNHNVIGRNSWANGIFPGLNSNIRESITEDLLALRCDANLESASQALIALPLTSNELSHALVSNQNYDDPRNLLAVTILSECITARAHKMMNDKHISLLISQLYDILRELSNNSSIISGDGSDYTRTCLLQALTVLTENISSLTKKQEKEIEPQSQLLVSLLEESSNTIKLLVSNRSKSICLRLLTQLCALSPSVVVESLVPAMIGVISSNRINLSSIKDTFLAIIPVYCEHAAMSSSSLFSLMKAVIDEVSNSDMSSVEKQQLICKLGESLLASVEDKYFGQVSASILIAYTASEAQNLAGNGSVQNDEDSPILMAKSVLAEVGPIIQIETSLQMLHFIDALLSNLNDDDGDRSEGTSNFFMIQVTDVVNMVSSSDCQKPHLSLMWCVITLIEIVKNIYAASNVKRAIRLSDGNQASICLNIWQELMILQSSVTIKHAKSCKGEKSGFLDEKFWFSVVDGLNKALVTLQSLLPVPHFLASISAMIENPDIDVEIKRRALFLLSERSGEIDPTSPEATLFLEMLPDLIKLAGEKAPGSENVDEFRCTSILAQSSFRAIDTFVKNFGLNMDDDKMLKKRLDIFYPAVQTVTNYLNRISSIFSFNVTNTDIIVSRNLEAQTLSSAALCASSLVTFMKAKCIPALPKLAHPLVNLLVDCNRFQKEYSVHSTSHSIQLVQMSVLRSVLAISDNLPQFFVPHIGPLLSINGLPSLCFRSHSNDGDLHVQSLVDRIERSISTHIPARQLLPVLSKAILFCISDTASLSESMVLLKMMKLSIDNAPRPDIAPMAGKIVHALLQAYSIECDIQTRLEIMDVANSTLLSMILKLSEAQLRPLYSKLREWRGEFEENHVDDTSSSKRYAFWSLSAAMAKELRSIFLPCMSAVVGDMVKELEYASSVLTSKVSKGNKRQKVSDAQDCDVSKIVGPLQSLLLCLEAALKADAHEGGNWIRSDEGERYRLILGPLGKLLASEIPRNTIIVSSLDEKDSKVSAYQRLVEGVGTEDHGNVVDCLSALATAAGNEQLWKPLNHTLLEACGNQSRSEVRKSGAKALLSIIHSLGEEYMVLLPECLPVLSELLEDEDENIVAIAKECVQQGEELLGESLEDSLR
jgi:U3 small nucleolar RNA-associated protein 10